MPDITNEEMLKVIQDNGEHLNNWELNFMENIEYLVGKQYPLSPARQHKLDQIFNKILKANPEAREILE